MNELFPEFDPRHLCVDASTQDIYSPVRNSRGTPQKYMSQKTMPQKNLGPSPDCSRKVKEELLPPHPNTNNVYRAPFPQSNMGQMPMFQAWNHLAQGKHRTFKSNTLPSPGPEQNRNSFQSHFQRQMRDGMQSQDEEFPNPYAGPVPAFYHVQKHSFSSSMMETGQQQIGNPLYVGNRFGNPYLRPNTGEYLTNRETFTPDHRATSAHHPMQQPRLPMPQYHASPVHSSNPGPAPSRKRTHAVANSHSDSNPRSNKQPRRPTPAPPRASSKRSTHGAPLNEKSGPRLKTHTPVSPVLIAPIPKLPNQMHPPPWTSAPTPLLSSLSSGTESHRGLSAGSQRRVLPNNLLPKLQSPRFSVDDEALINRLHADLTHQGSLIEPNGFQLSKAEIEKSLEHFDVEKYINSGFATPILLLPPAEELYDHTTADHMTNLLCAQVRCSMTPEKELLWTYESTALSPMNFPRQSY